MNLSIVFICLIALLVIEPLFVYRIMASKQETIRKINELNLEKYESQKKQYEQEVSSYRTTLIAQAQREINTSRATLEEELKQVQLELAASKSSLESAREFAQKEEESLRAQEVSNLEAYTQGLKQEYENRKSAMAAEYEEERVKLEAEISDLSSLRDSLIQAQVREKEIREKRDFYRIPLSLDEQEDVQKLLRFSNDFHNPQLLRKLVWSEFFLKSYGDLAARVIGTDKVCGIYKITNINNDMSYIGQSKDIKTRWSAHIKGALGIGSGARNKFYQAMYEDGIWNYTFEILEKCEPEKLNEREKYYIDFYKTSLYGLNSTKGGS